MLTTATFSLRSVHFSIHLTPSFAFFCIAFVSGNNFRRNFANYRWCIARVSLLMHFSYFLDAHSRTSPAKNKAKERCELSE